jgi:hypothetical protein
VTIILPALAVAFAAFCVWLAVRIFNRRERWAKWTLATVVGLPVLYAAAFGVAIRIATFPVPMGGVPRGTPPHACLTAFWPIGRLMELLGDSGIEKTKIMYRYMDLWMPDGWVVIVPTNADRSKSWLYRK